VEPLVADAERGLAAVAEEPYEPSVGRAASTLANAPAAIAVARANLARLRGNAERTSEFGQQALAQLTEDDRMLRFQVGLYLAVADWLRGQLPGPSRPWAAWPSSWPPVRATLARLSRSTTTSARCSAPAAT
jgi:LuxR family transcriptional regulator, maltose regulon positive regulatory protein